MKAYRTFPPLVALLLGLTAVACSDSSTGPVDETPAVNESQVLLQYLESTRSYDVQGGFVMSASAVRTNLLTNPAGQYVIDIRSAADYAKGHIPGAVNVNFSDVLTHVRGLSSASSFEKIVVTCYSGQGAAYAVGLLRAAGVTNAISMKWGMSSWHEDFAGPWMSNRSNARATQFETGPSPAMNPAGDLPVLNTGKKTGPDILEARLVALFAAGTGPATVNHNTLFQNLGGHYVANFWPASLYQNTGHIPGAVNYDPATNPWQSSTALKTLSTTKTNVVYCYTGQTSSYITAYLRLLGYDARSLLYGANSMIYDVMTAGNVANAFAPASEVMNYDYAK